MQMLVQNLPHFTQNLLRGVSLRSLGGFGRDNIALVGLTLHLFIIFLIFLIQKRHLTFTIFVKSAVLLSVSSKFFFCLLCDLQIFGLTAATASLPKRSSQFSSEILLNKLELTLDSREDMCEDSVSTVLF